jgi:hypothetical protein
VGLLAIVGTTAIICWGLYVYWGISQLWLARHVRRAKRRAEARPDLPSMKIITRGRP